MKRPRRQLFPHRVRRQKNTGRWWLTLVYVVLGVAACGTEQHVEECSSIATRLIADSNAKEFERSELFDQALVEEWRFRSPKDFLAWDLKDPVQTGQLDKNPVVLASGPRLRMNRQTMIDADSTHVLELSIAGLRKGPLKLYWARPGEEQSDSRRLTLQVVRSTGKQVHTYRLDLLTHPEWSGTVTRVFFDFPVGVGREIEIAEIRWLRHEVNDQRLAGALDRIWNVKLDSDVRPAWMCAPGASIERQVEVPAGAQLDFSFGIDPAVDEPVTFTVSMAEKGGSFTQLFADTINPRDGRSNRWYDAKIQLAATKTGPARLRFETSSEAKLNPVRAFAVWGNPKITTAQAPPLPLNVVVILLDTLRADRLSCYGHAQETSPYIDGWARDSAVLFENVVAPAPWTLPSHVSLFSGLDALRHGVNHKLSAPESLTLMAEMLGSRGYTTAAITGGAYLRPAFGLAQGFDSFRYWPNFDREDELADGIERAVAWLSQHRDRQFFLFFHTYEVHGPHRRREPFFGRLMGDEAARMPRVRIVSQVRKRQGPRFFGDYFVAIHPDTNEKVAHLDENEKELVRAMYDSAIAYTDSQVQRLLNHLDALGLRGRTLVVLTSDHGEALGEDDRAGHQYLNEYNVLVPLIIELPDRQGAGRRIADQVRLTDVLPTIFDVIGQPLEGTIDGVSLLPLIQGEPSHVPEQAWTYSASNNRGLGLRLGNRLKYVFNNSAWSDIVGEEELYNLEDDPSEKLDRAAEDPMTVELRELAQKVILEQHQGPRMEIRNEGPGVLHGTLGGAWSSSTLVKSVDNSCRCVRWREGQDPEFSLAPGEHTTLLFDDLNSPRAEISGCLDGLPNGRRYEFGETLELGASGGVGLVFTGSGWQRVSVDEDVDTGFRLWSASGRKPEYTEVEESPELLDQLRALGYVDR